MKKILYTILFYCCIVSTCLASASTPTLGSLDSSPTTLSYEGRALPTYKVFGEDYVPVSSLKAFGCTVNYDPATNGIIIEPSDTLPPSSSSALTDLSNHSFQLFDGTILIDDFQTHGVIASGHTLIPLGALRPIYAITIDGTTYSLSPTPSSPYIVNQSILANQSTFTSEITFTDIYFDGDYIYDSQTTLLEPSALLERTLTPPTESALYISSVITKIDTTDISYTNMYGQIKPELFEMYTYATSRNITAELGDFISLEDILKVENTMNTLGLQSQTPYLVWTDLAEQSTYIFEGKKGNWKLIKHFLCSTGKASSPTPKGTFKLTYKVPYFGVEKGYRCKNAFGFIGTTYLYHSVMFDKTGSYLLKGKGELGKPASAGCIRLSVPHSEWFYENMISGTTVYIQ